MTGQVLQGRDKPRQKRSCSHSRYGTWPGPGLRGTSPNLNVLPRASSGPGFHNLFQLNYLQHAALSPQQHRHSHSLGSDIWKVNPNEFFWKGAIFAHVTWLTNCPRNIWVTGGQDEARRAVRMCITPICQLGHCTRNIRRATEAGDAIL